MNLHKTILSLKPSGLLAQGLDDDVVFVSVPVSGFEDAKRVIIERDPTRIGQVIVTWLAYSERHTASFQEAHLMHFLRTMYLQRRINVALPAVQAQRLISVDVVC